MLRCCLLLNLGLAVCNPDPGQGTAPSPSVIADISADHSLKLIDVRAMVEQKVIEKPLDTDISFPLQNSDGASLHIHVLAAGQRVPLHVHPHAREFTLVLSGSPTTRHWFGEARALRQISELRQPGTLLQIPRGAAHEWINNSDTPQANLVFSRPGFYGNLYLSEDDPRLGDSEPPVIVLPKQLDPGPDVAYSLAPTGDAKLMGFYVNSEMPLPAAPGNSYLYVTGGEGVFETDRQQARLEEGKLLYFPDNVGAQIHSAKTLTGYIFQL